MYPATNSHRPPSFGRTLSTLALFFIAFALPAIAQVSTFPYSEDFETSNGSFTQYGSIGTVWRRGTPCGEFSTAHSGTNCWVSSPTSCDYPNYSSEYLESPVFDMTSLTKDPMLLFWQAYYFESCCDYGQVYYSTNGGSSWTFLEEMRGSNTTWHQKGYQLTGAAGQASVQLRFYFYSDVSVYYTGWGIDDVRVGDFACLPAGTNSSSAYFSNFNVGTINNSSTYSSGYDDYTNLLTTLIIDAAYNFSVTYQSSSSGAGYSTMWIDWNQDLTFEASEQYYFGNTTPGSTYVLPITVPSNAVEGHTLVRIRTQLASYSGTYPPACGKADYSEAEDYMINVINGNDEIHIDPTSLYFTAEETGPLPASQQVHVFTQPNPFDWSTLLTQSPAWMSVTPANATGEVWTTTDITTTSITPGVYTGTIRYWAVTAFPQDVAVTYDLVPRVMIEPEAATPILRIGCGNTAFVTKTVRIDNTGGHFDGGQLTWTATTSDPAITIQSGSGLESGLLRFTVNPAGLASGSSVKTITLTGYNSITGVPAANSPYTMNVVVEVAPAGNQVQTLPVGTAAFTQFTNQYGQVYAEVKSNSGNISSFTVSMMPCQIPNGFSRMRYARVWYTFASSTPSPNLDIKLTHSSGDDNPLVTRPDLLTIWRQASYPASNGAWTNLGGTANALANNVTLTGLSTITGRFSLAHAWNPKAMHTETFTAFYSVQKGAAVLEWETPIAANEEGFYVERLAENSNDPEGWQLIGTVPFEGAAKYQYTDAAFNEDSYYYRLSAVDAEGNQFETSPILVKRSASVAEFALEQNYPNPFNPETTIRYSVPETGPVTLKVFDMYWREVSTLVQREQAAGTYAVQFDASSLPSGVYFYRLQANGYSAARKMNLMK